MAGEITQFVLGDRCVVKSSKRVFAEEYVEFGIPFFRSKDVIDKALGEFHRYDLFISDKRYRELKETHGSPRKGDVLISSVGNRSGQSYVVKDEGDFYFKDGNIIWLSDFNELDPCCLSYWLKSTEGQHALSSVMIGSAQKALTIDSLRKLSVELPPLAEQKAIAAVLVALDDKIELNRRMNATLEAMARALFQSWFLDFDPVRAKLDGRKPIGLDEATAALFPDSFQESSLGHIPKGWSATTLGACIGFRSGFSFKSQDWQESGVPVVKIGSVKPGIIDLTQVSYVSEEIAQQAARYRLSTGDMLIGMTGYVGEVGLVPPSGNPPLLNQRVGKFVMANPGTESLAFWYCTTRQPEFKAFVEARSHGTAQANVSGESIMEFPLALPPSGILDSFNRDCQPLFDCILSNHGQSRTLATLRDTLLPKLLSGDLSVDQRSGVS